MERSFDVRGSGQVRLDGEVIAGPDLLEKWSQVIVAWPDLFPLAQDALGGVLRFLDVGLIERVDAEHRARDGGGELPTEKLPSQGDRFVESKQGRGMAGML